MSLKKERGGFRWIGSESDSESVEGEMLEKMKEVTEDVSSGKLLGDREENSSSEEEEDNE